LLVSFFRSLCCQGYYHCDGFCCIFFFFLVNFFPFCFFFFFIFFFCFWFLFGRRLCFGCNPVLFVVVEHSFFCMDGVSLLFLWTFGATPFFCLSHPQPCDQTRFEGCPVNPADRPSIIVVTTPHCCVVCGFVFSSTRNEFKVT